MAKRKYDDELHKTMLKDLMSAYREVAVYCTTQAMAWDETVKHPAPRYYVSAAWARHIIAPMLVGDYSKLNKLSQRRRRLYVSLYHKVIEASNKVEYRKMSLNKLLPHVINTPAPEFFISSYMCRTYFHQYRKQENETKGIR